jgi:hypothetical protein
VLFCADWTDATVFGAILALIVRGGGVRLAMCAALLRVFAFAIPAFGFPSSQAPLPAWCVLWLRRPATAEHLQLM